jgi:hypothetical protein
MKTVFGVYDNVLTLQERIDLFYSFFGDDNCIPSLWIKKEEIVHNQILHKLSLLIEKQIDTTDCAGYEFWTHNLSAPKYHYDKDEALFRKHGVNVFSEGTLVFYLEISNYEANVYDGRYALSTPDVIIAPKENRVVLMGSGILHGSAGVENVRKLVALSPWKEKPTQIDEIIFDKDFK